MATFAVGNPIERPRRSPSTTGPRISWAAPEHPVGVLQPALVQGPTDGRGGHLLVVAGRDAVGAHQPVARHLEAQLGAHLLEERHVAAPPVAEVEVLSHHHLPGVQAPDEDLGHELLRGLPRPLVVEVDHHHDVEPGVGQQLQALLEVGEQAGRGLGADDLRRVAVEGDQGADVTPLHGPAAHLGDHRPVPEVKPVVGPDGDHRPLLGGMALLGRSDDLHRHHATAGPVGPGHRPRGGTTTEGLTESPRCTS